MSNQNLSSVGYKIQSLDELRQFVPAAFAEGPHPDRSDRYTFVSTIDLINTFEKIGWKVFSAKQHGDNAYGRHIIRLANEEFGALPVNVDDITPHILLDNSHDGYTPATMHLGLFRKVCTNGLVIAMPGLSTMIKFRHINIDKAELLQVLAEAAEQYRQISNHIVDMQKRVLTQDERIEFAIKALALREPERFMLEDGKPNVKEITTALNPENLLTPNREADSEPNLWITFNVIQEKTMKGQYERLSPKGKKSSPREITNAARSLSFNKALWSIAEEYMGTISDVKAVIEVGKLYNYKTAKGELTSVEVVSDLGEGQYQVKSGSRLFPVSGNKLS